MTGGDTSGVTEEEFQSLLENGGETPEPSVEQDSTESETETEAEPEDETEEAEAAETKTKAEKDAIDWAKVDPRYKTAFEDAQKSAQKYERDHAKLQSQFAKESQTRKENERNLSELRQQAELLQRWEQTLKGNPRAYQLLEQELAKANDPFANAPEDLRSNPAFRYMQEQVSPYLKSLQEEIQGLKQYTGKIDSYESQAQTAKLQAQLDGQLDAAKAEIKDALGRDATNEEMKSVLEYMVENKFYSNGAAAAMAVFKDQFRQAMKAQNDTAMRDKAKKFGARNKTINPARSAGSKDHASTVEEAIAMAMAEQGA